MTASTVWQPHHITHMEKTEARPKSLYTRELILEYNSIRMQSNYLSGYAKRR